MRTMYEVLLKKVGYRAKNLEEIREEDGARYYGDREEIFQKKSEIRSLRGPPKQKKNLRSTNTQPSSTGE